MKTANFAWLSGLLLVAGLVLWTGCQKDEVFFSDDPMERTYASQGVQEDNPLGLDNAFLEMEKFLKEPVPPGYELQLIVGQILVDGALYYQDPEPPVFRIWGDNFLPDFGTASYIESYYQGEGMDYFGGEGIISRIIPDDDPEELSDRLSFYSIYKDTKEENGHTVGYSMLNFYEGTGAFEGAYGAALRKLTLVDPVNYTGKIEIIGYVFIPKING